ncbi:MAG: polysaccharide biosynthesis tyrosine autokinase [Ignavibacteriaceae bacterium]|nr:polysaccharide biosynthesis tyrosine autokinase [Ignavibacteriaceae bacterium]
MNNNNTNEFEFDELEGKNLKDYFNLIRKHLYSFLAILIISLIAAVYYVMQLPDIYVSETTVKISKGGGSILQTEPLLGLGDMGNDRMINNEIEILKSNDLRKIVATALTDSFNAAANKDEFKSIYVSEYGDKNKYLLGIKAIEKLLGDAVQIEQKRGLDVIVISAESPSPTEAALIAAVYAKVYRTYNLEINREQLSYIRNFLDQQRNEKKAELSQAEDTLRAFQEKGGIIALDEQAQNLIQQLSQFEAQMNAAKIELVASEGVLAKYKEELSKQDPKLADYLESITSETYITALQNQIAELQLNKDIALAKVESGIDISKKIEEYDSKIADLKQKLDEKIKVMKSGILASSPEAVRGISQKIIEAEVQNQSLRSTVGSLSSVVSEYEEKFNRLPKTTLQLARFKRTRESTEKLFTLIEEKYQEAVINEQSQAGNVLIIDNARVPDMPSKPNRKLMLLAGLLIAFGAAFGFVLLRDYFDYKVNTPEDIERKNVTALAWIPKVDHLTTSNVNGRDFIIENDPKSIPSESIRALRTRVQFSKLRRDQLKTILITSPAPQEGKSTIAINLAGSFAHSNRKTLLIDADLRKPRLHNVFKRDKEPGLINFLYGEVPFEKVVTETTTKNLYLVTAGSIVGNPSEVLDSDYMDNMIKKVREEYDYVIIDSPPIVAVTDAEILSRKVDGTILVVSSGKTEKNLLDLGLKLIKSDNSFLIGVVLNNFSQKTGYGSYYKYYYYYSADGKKKKSKQKKEDRLA